MLELLKKYIITVVSGVVALLAIVGIVLGVGNFSRARMKLEEAREQAERISTLAEGVTVETANGDRVPLIVNEDLLRQIREIRRLEKDQSNRVLQDALWFDIGYDKSKGTIKRQPLIEGIFPKPITSAHPFAFIPAYRSALTDLLAVQLKAGGPPTAEDIAREKENLAQQLGFHADQSGGQEKGMSPAMADGKSGPQLTDAGRELVAKQLAAIAKAQSIKIYATINSLDVVKEGWAPDAGMVPAVEVMWWAQMSLWLQQDIAAAIAEVNASAKDVSESVVKRIESIRIQHLCYFSTGGNVLEYYGMENPLSSFPDGFADIQANEFYDVAPFSLEVIVDLTRLPLLIDALYRQSHYLLYHWELASVQGEEWIGDRPAADKDRELYRYGSGPLARVTMYWQAFLMRDFYHWGIIGYGTDAQVRPTVTLYNGQTVVLERVDQREGKGLGLMPESIRKALSGGEEAVSSDRGRRRRGP